MEQMNEELNNISGISPTIIPLEEVAADTEESESLSTRDELSATILPSIKHVEKDLPKNCPACGVIITIKCECCPECGALLSKKSGMFL